jgi:hypothetical protein
VNQLNAVDTIAEQIHRDPAMIHIRFGGRSFSRP